MSVWKRNHPPRRSLTAQRTPLSSARSNPGVWHVFAALFLVSVLLILFVLVMQRQWRARGQRTIALVQQNSDPVRRPLTLITTDPTAGKSVILTMDPAQKISLLNREVKYPSDALVGFTQLENLDWDYLRLLLSLEYGVAVDGLIWVPATTVGQWSTVRWWAGRMLWQRWPSTLSYWDRFTWWRLTWQQTAEDAVQMQNAADFTQEDQLNTTKYDTWASTYLRDAQIQHSRMSVAVWNASGEQGLAARFSRLFMLMGYEVRSLDTVEPATESQIIFAQVPDEVNANQRWARRRLQDTLPQFTVTTDTDATRRTRTEAIVILGKDMIEMYR